MGRAKLIRLLLAIGEPELMRSFATAIEEACKQIQATSCSCQAAGNARELTFGAAAHPLTTTLVKSSIRATKIRSRLPLRVYNRIRWRLRAKFVPLWSPLTIISLNRLLHSLRVGLY